LPRSEPGWAHELKHDGYRLQIHVRDGRVRKELPSAPSGLRMTELKFVAAGTIEQQLRA
jgi:hypothetical protein